MAATKLETNIADILDHIYPGQIERTLDNEKLDYHQGTDMIFHGKDGQEYRLDPTNDVSLKEGTSRWDKVIEHDNKGGRMEQLSRCTVFSNSGYVDLTFEIRYDNNYIKDGKKADDFERPTIVIGVVQDDSKMLRNGNIGQSDKESFYEQFQDRFEHALGLYNEKIYDGKIENDPMCIGEVAYQTTSMQQVAIDNITPEQAVELASVCESPTNSIQLQLVEKDVNCIYEIDKPTAETVEYVISKIDPDDVVDLAADLWPDTQEVQEIFFDANPDTITCFKDISDAMVEKAVSSGTLDEETAYEVAKGIAMDRPSMSLKEQEVFTGLASINADVVKCCTIPPEKVQLAAVENKPEIIADIKNPTEAVQQKAVELNPNTIALIDRPRPSVQIAAVEQNPSLILDIKKPCAEAQLIAVKQDSSLIDKMENQTAELKEYLNDLESTKEDIHDVTAEIQFDVLIDMNDKYQEDIKTEVQQLVDNENTQEVEKPEDKKELIEANEYDNDDPVD